MTASPARRSLHLLALLLVGATACADLPAPEGDDASLGVVEGAATASALCGGPQGATCPDGTFCEGHTGQCKGGYGLCRPVPQTCPRSWSPVCGCDGVTYANDCKRRMAGVGKGTDGVCPEPGGTLGDPCTSNGDCPSGVCVETVLGHLCSVTCIDQCPTGWSCNAIGGGVDAIFACRPNEPFCEFDQAPVDLDGDAIADTCAMTCNTACDCYGKGAGFSEPCAKDCMSCDNYWTCHGGTCWEGCGPVPPSAAKCLGGQVGDPCGTGTPGCADGLACCYPCGIPGCQFTCQEPCDPAEPWCTGGCPLLP